MAARRRAAAGQWPASGSAERGSADCCGDPFFPVVRDGTRRLALGARARVVVARVGWLISCLGSFQNDLGPFWNNRNHVTLRRSVPRRPGRVGWLRWRPRTDGRVEVCAKPVPALAESRTFEQYVLKEEHLHQAFGQWRRHQPDGQSGLPLTALDHLSATERSPMSPPRPWVSVGTIHDQNASG